MTPKVMAYFFKNDYLKADVYDSYNAHLFCFFPLTADNFKKKIFLFLYFQSTTRRQYFYPLIAFTNKLEIPYLAEESIFLLHPRISTDYL